MTTSPTPPIELTGREPHLPSGVVPVPAEVVDRISDGCAVTADPDVLAESSRDWWPLALHWSLAGQVPQLAAVVARPSDVGQVAHVMRTCNDAGVPVTVSGGRSGVCGGAVPVFGGVVLDVTSLAGVRSVDEASGIVEVMAGTFGPDLEAQIRSEHDLTVGHFPQSFDLATVGGWIGSRGAGQYSTRYGKIEDMVVGLEAVLADGSIVTTGGAPAAAVGPDLTQLLIGSEGTLGVITRAWLRAHSVPRHERRFAATFATFEDGVEACRRVMRRGATPAVLRLYDADESARGRGGDGARCTLIVLDEADEHLVDATMTIVEEVVAALGGEPAPLSLVAEWLEHRNDTTALQALTRKGFVVDTMEIAAPWSRLDEIFEHVRAELMTVPHARAATCHLSHSYIDGACLYFTFAATPPEDEIEETYVALWDVGQRAVLAHGGNLSHHHGVGINRGRFVADALGTSFGMLSAIKSALDPNGIMNPGKFGLASNFGTDPWPT